MGNKTSSNQLATVLLLFTLISFSYSLETPDKAQKLINGQKLLSSQGKFELGFFNRSTPGRWYIGIWYKVSPDTIVWVVNRDHPMNDSSSTLAISESAIVLIDSSQNTTQLFGVNASIKNAFDPIMQLLDTGNLVIKYQNRDEILWQSFDYPTNTMLPGMKIGKNINSGLEWYLSSWKSSDDPSTGNYYYKMDTLSQPAEIVLWKGEKTIYKTGAWVGSRFSGLPEMATYNDMVNFTFVSKFYEVSWSFQSHKSASVLVLNETGILQRMLWDPKRNTWIVIWWWPNNMCDNYRRCGPFGICNINEAPICNCLQGFKVKSTEEWSMRNTSGGCRRKTRLSCRSDSNRFKLVKNVKLPDTQNAIVNTITTIKDCKRKCLVDCSCLAYSLVDISRSGRKCVIWGSDLVDIRYFERGQDLYIKLDKSELAEGKKTAQLLTGFGTSVVLILVSITVILIYRCQRKKKMGVAYLGKGKKNYNESATLQNTELPIHDLETVIAATANFSDVNKLGKGGFGVVYKGELPSGEEIAVKRLSRSSSQGINEFMNEVMLIAKLQHRNLVKLLGCCIHGSERMLIYEFMPHKSLDFFIFDDVRRGLLSWRTRLEIVKGISRGILYLHQDSRFNIIHRDLKAANILLDGEMTPKISDFGIARLFKREQNEMDTERVVGTRGYMSPEYAMEGKISVKSDVYSFGVLLLEIISGKRNQGNHNLLAHAWQQWQGGGIPQLLDEAIDSSTSTVASEIVRFVHVGLLCVQECADDRPTMSTVVSMLANEGCTLPEPKKPVLSTKITSEVVFDSANELTVTEVEGR